jgi:hypothetical protein
VVGRSKPAEEGGELPITGDDGGDGVPDEAEDAIDDDDDDDGAMAMFAAGARPRPARICAACGEPEPCAPATAVCAASETDGTGRVGDGMAKSGGDDGKNAGASTAIPVTVVRPCLGDGGSSLWCSCVITACNSSRTSWNVNVSLYPVCVCARARECNDVSE